jgi:peptidoglycan/xylan/chitin deacetylase (PgdA/CDA1 family)
MDAQSSTLPHLPMDFSVFSLKRCAANAISRVIDLDSLVRRSGQRYVLAYHRVIDAQKAQIDHVHDAMWISPQSFERQIIWMQKVGDIVSYDRILDMQTPSERTMFALTFDDGWRDNFDVAFPILKKYKAPAIIFAATAHISSGKLFWPEDLVTKTAHAVQAGRGRDIWNAISELTPQENQLPAADADLAQYVERLVEMLKKVSDNERKRRIAAYYARAKLGEEPILEELLTWDQAREMQEDGIRFGSHTHNHRIVTEMCSDELEDELIKSRDTLRAELKRDVDAFCYPNADYLGTEAPILQRCGFRYGFRLDDVSFKQYRNQYYVPRFIVYEQLVANPAFFKLRLLGMPI